MSKINLRPSRARSPFDNPLLAGLVHVVTAVTVCGAVYFSLTESTLWPLYAAGMFVSMLEGLWIYFRLRR